MKRTFILVSPYSSPKTGAHIRFDRLAIYLSKQGNTVIWISPRRNNITLGDNVEFLDTGDMTGKHWVSLWMSLGVLRHAFRLLQLRKTHDLLLISFGETNLIPSAVAAFLSNAPMSLGMRSNIKKCNKINTKNPKNPISKLNLILMPVAMAILGEIYRRAAQVTVQTPQAKISAIVNFGILESRIVIIENDLPIERTAEYAINSSVSTPRRALFIGDDSYVKGFDVLVSAIGAFSENAPTIKELTVIGISFEAFSELQRCLQPGGPQLTRFERTSELISVMAANDLLIVPSREDQFPNIVLEALALGLPVIGSNTDGIAYILNDHWLLFEPGNAADLLRTLSRLCTVDGYTHARQLVKTRAEKFRFDWEKRYFDLFSQVSQKK